jgi:uncharacterized protein
MLIGILADTHGYFHPALPRYLADADLIVHAGDVGTLEVLDGLEALGPTRAVFGNVDGRHIRLRAPEHQRFDVDGVSFWVTHIGGHPGRWEAGVAGALRREPPDVFVCGHSHILRIERVASLGDMLYVNPGAAGRQGFHQVKTCVRLFLRNGTPDRAEVVHLDEPGTL